jgi:hypothetical protein
MHAYKILTESPLDDSSPVARLRARFPWLRAWRLQVSPGLADVIEAFCEQVQRILGSEPELDFLYVLDEPVPDHDFQTKLVVFIEPKTRITAQGKAIEYFVQKAVRQAASLCRRCGEALAYGEDGDASGLHKVKPFESARGTLICRACTEHFAQLIQGDHPKADQQGPEFCSDPDPLSAWATFEDEDGASALDALGEDDEEEGETRRSGSGAIFETTDGDRKQDADGPQTLRVFHWADVEALERELVGAGRDREKHLKGLVSKLKEAGSDKRLALQPEGWRRYCDELMKRFPNFNEVITFLSYQMALSAMKQGIFSLPPFLLMGPPGIGKTEFLLTLAEDVNSTLEVIDMSAAQTGSTLTGSEAYWSNSQTGVLFNVLALGPVANPILLLDEIDKARKDQSYNPLAALHQLLEPRQAKQFKDLSVSALTLDASQVIWAATGNDLAGIDKPILDRFVVFEVNEPSSEQMRTIAHNQYRRVLERYGQADRFEPSLAPDTLAEIARFKPREARKIIQSALGRAAYHQRAFLTVEDIQVSSQVMSGRTKPRIGFV